MFVIIVALQVGFHNESDAKASCYFFYRIFVLIVQNINETLIRLLDAERKKRNKATVVTNDKSAI